MTRNVQILSTGSYVPQRVVTNAEVDLLMGESTAQWLIDNVGNGLVVSTAPGWAEITTGDQGMDSLADCEPGRAAALAGTACHWVRASTRTGSLRESIASRPHPYFDPIRRL